MTLSLDDTRRAMEAAVAAARAAAGYIATTRPEAVERKSTGTSLAAQVVTEVDRAAEAMIIDALMPISEELGLGLLTEEQPDDGSRFLREHFWCIDPLDGTLPFIEGESGFATSIGLVSQGGAPVASAVCVPDRGTVYAAARGVGLWRDDAAWKPLEGECGGRLNLYADRGFESNAGSDEVVRCLEAAARDLGLDGVDVHVGAGAVVCACSVLEGPPAVYFKVPKAKVGGGSLWDFAATACLFEEAGAAVSDFSGAPLPLNQKNTFMNECGVLYASDTKLAERVRVALGEPAVAGAG